jgi:hypothetical protein
MSNITSVALVFPTACTLQRNCVTAVLSGRFETRAYAGLHEAEIKLLCTERHFAAFSRHATYIYHVLLHHEDEKFTRTVTYSILFISQVLYDGKAIQG